jgi:hypothetical protein
MCGSPVARALILSSPNPCLKAAASNSTSDQSAPPFSVASAAPYGVLGQSMAAASAGKQKLQPWLEVFLQGFLPRIIKLIFWAAHGTLR